MGAWAVFWCAFALIGGGVGSAGASVSESAKETFSEEAVLRPLPDGRILAHFHFEQLSSEQRHHHLFPRAVHQLAHALDFEEIDIHFTRGRWRGRKWGEPVTPPKSPGAELIALFPKYLSASKLPQEWGNLTHALSGLLCSSLNLLEKPEMVLLPKSILNLARESDTHASWVYGTLSEEPVCTENLTPWLKLLPCRDSKGIASLLSHRPKLYSTDYHSLGMVVNVLRSENGTVSLRLTQTLTMVMNPFEVSTQPLVPPTNWTLSSLFGHELQNECAVATSSGVFLEIPKELALYADTGSHSSSGNWNGAWKINKKAPFQVHPPPSKVSGSIQDTRGLLLTYEQVPKASLDLGIDWNQEMNSFGSTWDVLHNDAQAQTFQSNIRGDSGGLVLELTWPFRSTTQEVVCFLQQVPWYLRIWIHSIQILFDGKTVHANDVVTSQDYHISEDRQAPFGLEMCLKVPSGIQSVEVSCSFSKAYLSVVEHPPGVDRGYDVPPTLVVFPDVWIEGHSTGLNGTHVQPKHLSPLLKILHTRRRRQVYTQGTLVHLPLPDFSMPYNVCCMSCTVIAVYIGMILKMLMRREKDEVRKAAKKPEKGAKRVLKALLLYAGIGALILVIDSDARDTVATFLSDWGIISLEPQGMEL